MSTRQAQEQILTQFKDGKLLVDFRGYPQANYSTGGVTHRFNLLSRVIRVLNAQMEGTAVTIEAVEYGTSNAVKLKLYGMTGAGVEALDNATITPNVIDVTVIGY